MDDQAAKQQRAQRQIAMKTSIAAIKQGTFIAKEGWEPHVVQIEGVQIARVNLIGVIVAKQAQSPMLNYGHAVLEDGSDRIMLRSFSDAQIFAGIEIGNVCLVIGRPREYGQEIYVVPEIVRRLDDPAWLSLRALELAEIEQQRRRVANLAQHANVNSHCIPTRDGHDDAPREKTHHNLPQMAANSERAVALRTFGEADVLRMLRSLDDGAGVHIEKLIDACRHEAAEQVVHLLLQKGDIFEIRPGIIKILE